MKSVAVPGVTDASASPGNESVCSRSSTNAPAHALPSK
jgi:hypothetical protein